MMDSISLFVFVLLVQVTAASDSQEDVISARVIGGQTTAPGQFSFVGSLQAENGKHVCGVSLVKNDLAVTAAHCFEGKPKPTKVVFGDTSLSHPSSYHHVSTFTVTVHSNYNDDTLINDIALLNLSNPIPSTNSFISTVPYGLSNDEFIYSECNVVGWGYDGSKYPDDLQYGNVLLKNPEECEAEYVAEYVGDYSRSSMICSERGSTDACKDDSGGPLACKRKSSDSLELVGIVSSGPTCVAQKESVGVYTRVSAFREWIDANGSAKASMFQLVFVLLVSLVASSGIC